MKKTIILLGLTTILICGSGCTMSEMCARGGMVGYLSADKSPAARELRMALDFEPRNEKGELIIPGVSEMPERNIQVQFPTILALACLDSGRGRSDWSLASPDPETTKAFEEQFKDFDAIKRIEPLVSFDRGQTPITMLRRRAAALGADLLFVYTTNTLVDDCFNPAAWGYFTGVGLFCIPGNNIKATAAAQGILIDVKSGFPLAVITVKDKKTGRAIAAVNLGAKLLEYEEMVRAECEKKMVSRLLKKTLSVVVEQKK